MGKKYYPSLDGLRAFAAIGIVMMHMTTWTKYNISGYIYGEIIPSFTDLVYLFMTISAFSMCCGYYKKIENNEITVSEFYSRRISRIFPFFAVLVIADIIISPSLDSLYEAFANLTLLFGFLPKAGNLEVIGVGWFIGLAFVFYICFPFFCFILQNKKRAWFAFGVSILMNYVSTAYFDNSDRRNIYYSACFFVAGGLIYLYRDTLCKINKWLLLLPVAASVAAYYLIGAYDIIRLLICASLTIFAVSHDSKFLGNKVAHFFSSNSMEIYLSHMVMFRVIEKLHLNTIINNDVIQYIFTVSVVVALAAIYSVLFKYAQRKLEDCIKNRKKSKSPESNKL